jgi:hypothetical protein
MVITVVFDASYANADINRYYLGPILWAWTWIGCLAADVAAAVVAAWAVLSRRRVETMAAAGAFVVLLLAVGLLVPTAADFSNRRILADRHLDPGATSWLDEVLPAVAQNAVVVSWWSTSTPLWYAEFVEGRRTDLEVVDDRTILDRGYGSAEGAIAQFLGRRPVYVIRANDRDLAEVSASYQLQAVAGSGDLTIYRVLGPAG